MNERTVLDKKIITLKQVLNYLISNNNSLNPNQDYFLIYLNILKTLEGFDYDFFKDLLSSNIKNKLDYRILFIILESILKDYYVSIDEIKDKYNFLNSKKYYRFSIKEKEVFNLSIINNFSILTDCNKNFKSDRETYIEYVIKDETSSIINFEQLFTTEIIQDLKNHLNRDKAIEYFTYKYNIKDLLIINNLKEVYDLIFKNIKSAYKFLDIPKEIKKTSLKNKNNLTDNNSDILDNDNYSEINNSFNEDIVDKKDIELNINSQKKYKNILTPFIVPNIKREDTYIIHNRVAYFNIDIFDDNIKKDIYDIVPNASNYTLPYNKNKILLQALAKKEINEYARDLITELKENNLAISEYGFFRIYDIHKNWSNFSNFSIEYRDFIDSKFIKENDYFEIILEYKKGTATRNFLDVFLKEQQYKYFDVLHEDEFEAIVDDALFNWERDIKDIFISSPDYINFFKGVIYAPVFDENIIKKFIPEFYWIEHKITFDINEDKKVFDNINSLREYYQIFLKTNIEDSYELLKRLRENKDKELILFWFNIFIRFEKSLLNINIDTENGFIAFLSCIRTRINEVNDFFKNSFNSALKIEKLIYEQEKWIFEYNKSILESKKKIILNALEEYTKNS